MINGESGENEPRQPVTPGAHCFYGRLHRENLLRSGLLQERLDTPGKGLGSWVLVLAGTLPGMGYVFTILQVV